MSVCSCMREYHLSCVKPAIVEVPEGEFHCFNCSKHGTTSNLIHYFDDCDEDRELVTTSKEFVQMVLHDTMEDVLCQEEENNAINDESSDNPKESPTDANGDAKVIDLIEDSSTNKKDKQNKSSTSNKKVKENNMTEEQYPLHKMAPNSEVSRITSMYYDMMNDSKFSNGNSKSSTLKENAKAGALPSTTLPEIGPEFLVGKPLRLYNANENSYHNGRILDWRLARSHSYQHDSSSNDNSSNYGDGKIAQCEFFVRFPAGMNGRKTTLHRWIILEEHCVAVTIGLVWAQRDKGRGVAGWRPAQVLLRSSMELISIRKFLHDGPRSNWALVGFFGEEDYSYVNLLDSTVDFFSSTAFHSFRNAKLNLKPAKTNHVCGQNEAVDIAISLLTIEREEQLRVFKWHNLPLKNRAHQRALTIMDESNLEPLLIEPPDENKKYKESYSSKDVIRPKLCPLIERGLDRLWIASLVGDDNIENSIDTYSSFRVSFIDTENKASIMAKLKEQSL